MELPGRISAEYFKGNPATAFVKNEKGEGWVFARPLPFYSWKERWKCAWYVFTGKADALFWKEQ